MTLIAAMAAQWVLIAVALLVGLAGFGLIAKNLAAILQLKRQRSGRRPVIGRPPQISRRAFFRKGMLLGFGVAMLDFAGASLAFLWPNLRGGFGGKVTLATSVDEIRQEIRTQRKPFYHAPGRFYIVEYGKTDDVSNPYVKEGVANGGLMALYQRCPHLGCRVPFCATSQWFECPCHGSKYNAAGEYKLGPAPRGMDRMVMTVDGGTMTVDTGNIVLGPARGTNTTGQNPEGPFCVEQVREG